MSEEIIVALITAASTIIAAGIPTAVTCILNNNRKKQINDVNKETIVFQESMKKGMQKSLKHDLIDIYEKCMEAYKCNARPVSKQDLDDFMDIYEVYHSLGANGKMDARKDWMIAHQEVVEIGDHE